MGVLNAATPLRRVRSAVSCASRLAPCGAWVITRYATPCVALNPINPTGVLLPPAPGSVSVAVVVGILRAVRNASSVAVTARGVGGGGGIRVRHKRKAAGVWRRGDAQLQAVRQAVSVGVRVGGAGAGVAFALE